MKDYRVILVIWIALGVAVSGYFYIYPPLTHPDGNRTRRVKLVKNYENSKVAILTTIVGTIVIGGLGYIYKQKKG